jgi:hypothetical protein
MGSAHYSGLIPMNGRWLVAIKPRAIALACFPICNAPLLNGAFVAAHQSRGWHGGFDEDDVLVAVSLPAMVLDARCAPSSRRENSQDPANHAFIDGDAASRSASGFFGPGEYFQFVIRMFRTKARPGDTEI